MTASTLLIPSRRSFLSQVGLLGLTALSWPAGAQSSANDASSGDVQPPDGSPSSYEPLRFKAYRNGSELGTHRIDFAEEDGRLIVDIDIAFDVTLAIIPVYRYRHRNREIWENGRLLSLNSETDDNGEDYEVRARAEGERLLVDGSGGKLELPADTVTTSYWNEASMARGEWLDTQKGTLARSDVSKKPSETITVEAEDVEATPYALAGDITCMLWYRDGRWVKLRFDGEDGSTIDYVLEGDGQSG